MTISEGIAASRDAIETAWPHIRNISPALARCAYWPIEGVQSLFAEELDKYHHIDALAISRSAWYPISTRHQPTFDYPTITLRPTEFKYYQRSEEYLVPRLHIQVYGPASDPLRIIIVDIGKMRHWLGTPDFEELVEPRQSSSIAFYQITAERLERVGALVAHWVAEPWYLRNGVR